MWDLQTLKRLNEEQEQKLQRETASGELEFEKAKKLDTRNKD